MEKFVVTPKEDKAVTMTIRIDRTLQEKCKIRLTYNVKRTILKM